MDFIVLSLRIIALTELTDSFPIRKQMLDLGELEEDRFIIGFHQQIQKMSEKTWHD